MINYKVWSFPTFPISKQLFTASGQAIDGGMTVGGIRMIAPEPGGRSMLEIQPSLQVNEWDHPISSWLMSKINGDIFRVRLAPTPQVALALAGRLGVPWASGTGYPETPWSNQKNWDGDAFTTYSAAALEGTNIVKVAMAGLGRVLRPGHAIGHRDNCYLIDEIDYDNKTGVATITVNPPLRKAVVIGDTALLRPFFLGSISNGDEMRVTYDAANAGHIQLGVIRFNEVIL